MIVGIDDPSVVVDATRENPTLRSADEAKLPAVPESQVNLLSLMSRWHLKISCSYRAQHVPLG